ncbi:MAG: Fic family protein [Gammaproteobacteria bacterium]|nr:Fic family protein [Gammaproteobacteria bacterium]
MKTPFQPQNLPLESLNWASLVPHLGAAHEGLARFDALLGNIPNTALLLAPLTAQEAVLSSRIEGTQASLEDVLRFEAEGKAEGEKRDDIQEVINYRIALNRAHDRMQTLPLSGRLLKEAHRILLDGARGKNTAPGDFRSGQVYIGKTRDIEQAKYIPPEAPKIPALFANLEKYMHRNEQDTLVQLAIVHAQFEIIHPFWDGNGRIGRLLIPLFLYHKQAISAPCFYLSEYLEKNRGDYYDGLNRITEEDNWEQWIQFFLRAVAEQSRVSAGKAQSIIDLKEKILRQVQQITRSQYVPQMTDFIFSTPWFASVQFRDQASVPRPSVARLLNLLEAGGIIEKMWPGKGRRASIYFFPELLKIIG